MYCWLCFFFYHCQGPGHQAEQYRSPGARGVWVVQKTFLALSYLGLSLSLGCCTIIPDTLVWWPLAHILLVQLSKKCCYDSVDEMVKVACAVLADTIALQKIT